ncbi:hypothetical protein [Streptomyces griseus]
MTRICRHPLRIVPHAPELHQAQQEVYLLEALYELPARTRPAPAAG